MLEAEVPQLTTRDGRTAVVLIAYEEWERKSKRAGNLAEFFGASPLRDSDLSFERSTEQPRKIEL